MKSLFHHDQIWLSFLNPRTQAGSLVYKPSQQIREQERAPSRPQTQASQSPVQESGPPKPRGAKADS
jgi:hypothetical protein